MNKTFEIYLKILLHILWFIEYIVDRVYTPNRLWISYRLEQRFLTRKVSKEFIELLERIITEESKNEKVDDLDKFLENL